MQGMMQQQRVRRVERQMEVEQQTQQRQTKRMKESAPAHAHEVAAVSARMINCSRYCCCCCC
jgi:hypothetical protein